MLRITKIALVATVALWAFLGVFYNIYDWSETTGAVRATTSMSTFEGGADDWRATSSPAIIWMGALFIMITKSITGILCAIGGFRMWSARRDSSAFTAAKKFALSGCGVAMIALFGGWIVIAETWFELWRSDALRDMALQSAFRYGAMITLIALFVGMENDQA